MENEVRPKNDKINKIVKITLKVLYQLLMIMCVLLILIIVFQKISDNNKSIGGYRIFRVITGSMEPEYDVGTVVISKEVEPSEIKVGDDIVYLGKYGEFNGRIIMHQVTAIDEKEDGTRNFHAAGLYNTNIEDPQIDASQIFGVVKFQSWILTVTYKLATSIYSSFIIISVLVLNVFVSFKFSGKSVLPKGEIEDDEEIDEEDYEEDYEEELEDVEEVEETEEVIEDEEE